MNKHFTSNILFFALLLFARVSFAQYGPGGVGNATGINGQPLMHLWFRADVSSEVVRTPSGKVTRWKDVSGNNRAANQTDTLLSPTYVTGAINGKPAIRFNGTSNARLFGWFPDSVAIGPMTFIVVCKEIASTAPVGGVFCYNGYYGIYHENTNGVNNYVLDGDGANAAGAANTNVNTSAYHIVTGVYSATANTTKNSSMFADGALQENYNPFYGKDLIKYTGFELGGRTYGNWYTRTYAGDIAEAVSFRSNLDSAKRILIENYLGAKYGLNTKGNRYAHWNTTFRNQVAGIGRFNATSTSLEGSSDVITLKDPQNLADNRFMLMGHNAGSIAFNTVETPNNDVNYTLRAPREYRFDKTGGDLGATRILVDFSVMNSYVPAGYQRGIFIDADGDFRAGAQFIDLSSFSGNLYQSPLVNIPDNWYLTIGCVKRTVSLTSSTGSGFENGVQFPSVIAALNYPYDGSSGNNVTITYTTAPIGTYPATGPGDNDGINDYNSTRFEATILAGQASVDLNQGAFETDAALEINNDGESEANTETMRLSINTISGAFFGNSLTYTYYITDDDFFRKISISSGLITSWAELDQGQFLDVNVQLELVSGQVGGPTAVSLVIPAPCTAGKDYIFLDAINMEDSVFRDTIDAGQRFSTVRLRLLGDDNDEDNEALTINLFDPESGTLSQVNPISHTINVIDNDAAPSVRFASTGIRSSESVLAYNVEVNLSRASEKVINVPFTINGASTAISGATDYDIPSLTPLLFAKGDSAEVIPMAISDDQIEEEEETVVIVLSANPTNAVQGSPSTFTYTIVDNDIYGSTGPGGVDKGGTLGGSLGLWLRADGPVTITSGKVSTWGDASGNGFNATQTTASKRPTQVANVVNGKPVIRFSKTGKTNMRGDFVPDQRVNPVQMFVVAKNIATTSTFSGMFCTNKWGGIYSDAGNAAVTDGFTFASGFDVNATAATSSNTPTNPTQMAQFNIFDSQYLSNSTQNSDRKSVV